MKDKSSMCEALSSFFKALVRPYIICSSWTVILLMWMQEVEIPPLLLGAAGAILSEYVLERVKLRWTKKNG